MIGSMPADSYRELKELFGQAVELEPEDRAAFLDAACGTDSDLREQLERLLAHDRRAESFLERPAPADAGSLLSPAEALQVGDMVEHFRVMRLLGRGGMGQVFLARDTKLGRKVALKLIHPGLLGTAEAEQRFLTEARTTARFSHPNIVAIHAVGEHRGIPYVALEYLEGENLAQRCAERSLSLPEVMRIGTALAKALREAHRHGVLHRDLKPENVVIAKDGRLRVVDFGLARRWRQPESRARSGAAISGDSVPPPSVGPAEIGEEPRRRAMAGTPRYMAPEQWMLGECTGATDIWALGVILYELIVGEQMYPPPVSLEPVGLEALVERTVPGAGLAPRAPATTELAYQGQRVCAVAPCPRVDERADAPVELADLVARCLEKDPRARPSANDVVNGLSELLAGPRLSLVGEDSPFRGLLAFTEQHADLFFGREREVVALLEKLRARPLLPIIGPSGAGKSSLVQAGLLPRLHEQEAWTVLHVRPGNRPFVALATALQRVDSTRSNAESAADEMALAEWTNPADLGAQLRTTPRLLSVMLRSLAEADNAKVMMVVDQLEELLTMVDDAQLRANYLEAICTAADDPQDPVRVVLTARDDFLGQLAMGPEVVDALAQVVVIQRLEREALVEILARPIELAGYAYEDEELIDEMVDAVGGESACLPLLQFAAQLLWEQRDRSARLLTRAAYDAMGGVEGAIANHADGVLDGFTPEVAVGAAVLRFDVDGKERGRKQAGPDISAVGQIGDKLVFGTSVGELVVQGDAHIALAQVPRSPVRCLLGGPSGTLLAGFDSGVVGMWSLDDGALLAKARMPGRIVHLQRDATTLFAASELGHRLVWDLSLFEQSYCKALRGMWDAVPVVWRSGRVGIEEPASAHPCMRR